MPPDNPGVRVLTAWFYKLSRRTRKRVCWGVGLVLFYTVFGFLILPLIVRAVAVKQLAKILDREVTIEKVRLNPYVLSGTIRGLVVKDKDGERFIALQEGYANFQLISFFQRAWTFKEVRVVGPYARVQVNKDLTLNFTDLLKKFSGPETAPPKKPSKPLVLRVDQFHISGAQLSYADLTPSTPFHRMIGPVELTLTGLETDPENKNPYSFSGTTDSGERFSWSGYFFLDPIRSRGEFSVENVALPKYAPVYQDFLRFQLRDGVINLGAAYDFAWSTTTNVAVVTNATFHLHSLKVAEKDSQENFVELDDLNVQGASADAIGRRVVVDSVVVTGGRLVVRRTPDAKVNVIEMAKPAGTNVAGTVMLMLRSATNLFAQLLASTNAGTAQMRSIKAQDCAVTLVDSANARPVRLALTDISMQATNLSNLPGTKMALESSVRWNTNGTIHTTVTAGLSPPTADVRLKLEQLELAPLGPYLDQFVSLFILGSKFSMDGQVQLVATNELGPDATFNGNMRLDDFTGVDGDTDEEVLKWGSVRLSGIKANLNPPEFALAELAIDDVNAHVVVETNQTLNLMRIARLTNTNAPAAEPATASPAAAKESSDPRKKIGLLAKSFSSTNLAFLKAPLKASVETIVFSNAQVRLEDRSVHPPARVSVTKVSGTITGISTELKNDIVAKLQARVGGTGPVEITGDLPPPGPATTNQFKIVVKDVNLVPAGPYSGKFLGYTLQRGRFNLDMKYEMTGRKMKAQNAVMLDQFTLGEKVSSPDATKLPVKLAIAILKDRSGKIELNVPIEGDLDDPKFHLSGVILHVIANVITKLVTSPFAALGSLFGGKGEEVSYQPFAPGSAELQAASRDKLDALLKGLHERPGLQLEIEGSYDPVADGTALRRQKLQKQFRAAKWATLRKSEKERVSPDQVPFTDEEYAAALNQAYKALVAAQAANPGHNGTAPVARVTSKPASPSRPMAAPAALGGEEKGAGLLLQDAQKAAPAAPESDMERLVFETISVSEDDFQRLAHERAVHAQQAILSSGQIEAERVLLAEPGSEESTNRASRVFFHLK
ncbi:MAG TPA: DUF748 domain-containing protein [Candidatus Binatia bacterium]|jgi:hypothetical protein|nr:DUF748 domain-containing protein [Candidatus Binatia bacterium]